MSPIDASEHETAGQESAPRLSRGRFAQAVAGAAVVGLNLTAGRWVATASGDEQSTNQFAALPDLDGTLLLDDASRTLYAQDFGQIVSERPLAVLKPGSVRDVKRMLRFARHHDLRIVGRGGAHTAFGQSQHRAGIVFDLTTFDDIGPIHDRCITIGAGCRWRDVLASTLEHGLMPVVLPDYIGQTVGGTLSVGGIGAMTFHHGAQIDHVVRLLVVTGSGDVVECSRHRDRELFEMLLAGQGQVGVIVEATMRLAPAPTTVRLYDLLYPDLDTMLTDITTLVDDRRFEQMEAFAFPLGGGAFGYLLEAIAFHRGDDVPDDDTLLAGLSAILEQSAINDLPFSDWANRVPDQRTQPHPWIDMIVPMSQASTFLTEVEDEITPVVPGDTFSLLFIPMRTSTFTRPLFRAPSEELAMGLGTLRFLPVGTDVREVLRFNRWVYDRAIELGGSAYPISAVALDVDDWRRHYGEQWRRLRSAKRRFDHTNVLASGPDVLGGRSSRPSPDHRRALDG